MRRTTNGMPELTFGQLSAHQMSHYQRFFFFLLILIVTLFFLLFLALSFFYPRNPLQICKIRLPGCLLSVTVYLDLGFSFYYLELENSGYKEHSNGKNNCRTVACSFFYCFLHFYFLIEKLNSSRSLCLPFLSQIPFEF